MVAISWRQSIKPTQTYSEVSEQHLHLFRCLEKFREDLRSCLRLNLSQVWGDVRVSSGQLRPMLANDYTNWGWSLPELGPMFANFGLALARVFGRCWRKLGQTSAQISQSCSS